MRPFFLALVAGAAGVVLAPQKAAADEGGVSFWLPGQFGALAATPQAPGWSAGAIGLHTVLDGDGQVAASRQNTINGLPVNVDVDLNLDLDGHLDLLFVSPMYTFAKAVLGGQLTLGAGFGYGYNDSSIDGVLTLTSPNGGTITRTGEIHDNRWGWADLYPQAQLRWHDGTSNYLAYVMGDIPIGSYNSKRLANFGVGHGAIDVGGGYTYFNPVKGRELSAVTGFTYNFENEDTDYQNGIDWHLDWEASQFVSERVHLGLVGYFYEQLTDDDGVADFLGGFKSSTIGVGPEIGYLLPVGGAQGYVNLKGYGDIDTDNRPEGYSVWLTLAVSPRAPHH